MPDFFVAKNLAFKNWAILLQKIFVNTMNLHRKFDLQNKGVFLRMFKNRQKFENFLHF